MTHHNIRLIVTGQGSTQDATRRAHELNLNRRCDLTVLFFAAATGDKGGLGSHISWQQLSYSSHWSSESLSTVSSGDNPPYAAAVQRPIVALKPPSPPESLKLRFCAQAARPGAAKTRCLKAKAGVHPWAGENMAKIRTILGRQGQQERKTGSVRVKPTERTLPKTRRSAPLLRGAGRARAGAAQQGHRRTAPGRAVQAEAQALP